MNHSVKFAAGLITVWIIGYLLIAGRGLLMPLVIAIFIWNLLNTINHAVHRLPLIGERLPNWLTMICSLSIVFVMLTQLVDIISNNVNEVIAVAPKYQENLMSIFANIDKKFHIKALASFDSFIKSFNVQTILVNIYGVFTGIMGSAVLIVMYVVFLFVEQHFFNYKLEALFSQSKHLQVVNSIKDHIAKDIQTYLGLKTLMSLFTATSSWVIMKAVGLDFAEFWALLIFFLNFIPNIGSMIATAFPALLAMIQFQSWLPFVIITSGIILVQFVVGNIVEPRFLGKSLNLSPLVILISLGLWGLIWGVLGMFLSVPITVILMIVFAHFESTRSVAIMLSLDGNINKTYESA